MLKYGKGSSHSTQQPLNDVCRDLHCERERYTWTSHPALEGTMCGSNLVRKYLIWGIKVAPSGWYLYSSDMTLNDYGVIWDNRKNHQTLGKHIFYWQQAWDFFVEIQKFLPVGNGWLKSWLPMFLSSSLRNTRMMANYYFK